VVTLFRTHRNAKSELLGFFSKITIRQQFCNPDKSDPFIVYSSVPHSPLNIKTSAYDLQLAVIIITKKK
jgi:hypothetical protein